MVHGDESCILASVNEADFHKFVVKVQNRNKQRLNNFLEGLIYFKNWTTKLLNKLQMSLEKVSYIRN